MSERVLGATFITATIRLTESIGNGEGTRVTITDTSNAANTFTGITDSTGSISFQNVDVEKTYSLKVKKAGYQEYIQGNISFSGNSTYTVPALTYIGKYNIITSSGEHGTITPSLNACNLGKQNTKITAIADTYYRISRFTVNGEDIEAAVTNNSGRNASYTYMIPYLDNDYEISVEFELIRYGVTFTTSGDGSGIIKDTSGINMYSGSVNINGGDSFGFMAVPSAHSHIKSISVNGSNITLNDYTEGSYTYTLSDNVNSNYTVNVEYELDKYPVNISVGDHGKLYYGNTKITGNTSFPYGSSPKFTIVPDEDYNFSFMVNGEQKSIEPTDAEGYTYSFNNIIDGNNTIAVTFSEYETTNSSEAVSMPFTQPGFYITKRTIGNQ